MTPIRLRLLALAAIAAIAVSACGSDGKADNSAVSGATSGTPKALADGTLTVCSDIPYPPFEFTEGDEVKGIDADLLRGIGEELEVDVEFRDTDFDGIFAALAAGQCDVIASSVSITEERQKNNLFSDGYFEINQSLLVATADAASVKDLPDLKGKVVGVQSETTGAAFAQERATTAGFTIKEFTGADELLTALKAGQIAGVVQDYPVNAYEATKTGQSKVVKVFTETDKESYGIVIPKGQTDLQKAVNTALASLRSSGAYDKILATYLGDSEA